MMTSERIEHLQNSYLNDEISEEQFDKLLPAAINEEPPYHKDWLLKQEGVRRTGDVFLYRGEQYIINGDMAVESDEDFTVRGRKSMVTDDAIEKDADEKSVSTDVSERQEELRQKILGQ